MELKELALWEKMAARRAPVSFEVEITARCNNDCRHCYINLPAGDRCAKVAELPVDEILEIAGEAAGMGTVWCLVTGGEPLLREDFPEIYLGLKRLGLLVAVFTNACLVTPAHVELFREYPPRDIEVTVYGATRETYETVTRTQGSWERFTRGLDLLLGGGVKVRLKAMVMRSNVHEIDEISRFCRERTKDYFRFDPLLHLRFDGDPVRNTMIKSERLSPTEVVEIEQADGERRTALRHSYTVIEPVSPECTPGGYGGLFRCGAGMSDFAVAHDGTFRLCSSLWHPATTYDLRRGDLHEAWEEWVPEVRALRSSDPEYLEKCHLCPIADLCLWCPAHAALETGEMDQWVEYFCEVAHARVAAAQAGQEPG